MKDIDNVIEQASELLEKGGISAVKEAFVDKPDVNKDNQTDKPVEEEDNIVSRLRKLRMKTSEKEETRFDVPSLDDLFSLKAPSVSVRYQDKKKVPKIEVKDSITAAEGTETDTVEAIDADAEKDREEFLKPSEFADATCTICNGFGKIYSEFAGWTDCQCVRRNKEHKLLQEQIEREHKEQEKKIEELLHSDTIENRLWKKGLVHPEKAMNVFSPSRFKDVIAERSRDGAFAKESTVDETLELMTSILNTLAFGNRLDRSIIISSPFSDLNEDFAITVIKYALLNGKSVVPYESLLRISKKKMDYIFDNNWRRGNGYLTNEEESIMKFLSAEERRHYIEAKANWEESLSKQEWFEYLESQTVVENLDKDMQDKVYQHRRERYTYQDYMDADILICWLSAPDAVYTEVSTLGSLLEERAINCKATIIMTARDIKSYKSSRKGVGTDLYLLENLVSEERYKANYRVAEYKAIKLSKTPKNKVEG